LEKKDKSEGLVFFFLTWVFFPKSKNSEGLTAWKATY